uniref:VP1 protein n=1 Tax=Chaerephon bat polyomavirus TaxID=3141916 RepID=A0AAU7E3F9_9POLY
MAPKKRPRYATSSCPGQNQQKCPPQRCPPKCVPRTCPVPTPVPRLLIKGGVEVLNVITGPDVTTEIELFLQPRAGINSSETGTTLEKPWYGFSEVIHQTDGGDTSHYIKRTQMPTYACARVQLPLLNDDMTCQTLQMWEAVSCKTEVIGAGLLLDVHIKESKESGSSGPGEPLQGGQFHIFAVGGEPLDLQGLVMKGDLAENHESKLMVHPNDITKFSATNVNRLQGLVTAAKAQLDKDGVYPIEEWHPDPAKNENSRYYGNVVGGLSTPPTLQFTNSVTTVLLDENGIGPLCKGDGLFVSSADIIGALHKANSGIRYRGLPRYFKITLRKRAVKNPYPITSLLGSLFSGLMPKIDGQPMSGPSNQIEEVRVYQGKEGLPADPDMRRFIDQFGQSQTQTPQSL